MIIYLDPNKLYNKKNEKKKKWKKKFILDNFDSETSNMKNQI